MTSNSKKITIIIAVVFVIALIFLIGVVFFGKENRDTEIIDNQNDQQQISDKDPENEITAEQKAKTFAENFTVTYHSYTWGNFSNIEAQYYYMTYAMKDREMNKVEQLKRGIGNQPQKYFTARAKLIDSNFISYEEEKATLEINLKIKSYAGAMVERNTMVWVDERGDYYEGDLDNLIVSTIEKKIKIELLKFDGEWKIDRVEEIGK